MLLLILAAVSVLEEKRQRVAEADGLQALERMVEVKGHIRSADHQGVGRKSVPGVIVAFQRMRDDHIVAVRVDPEGFYEVFLERGIYRVIVPKAKTDGTGQIEMLANGEEEYIDLEESGLGVHFDIEISQDDL
jgi:hypothetical protein